jgi:uncharacterized protein
VTAYFDTSAVVKLVIDETGAAVVRRVWDGASHVFSSVCLYPEMRAALARARRDRRLDDVSLRAALRAFETLWVTVERIIVSLRIAQRAGLLAHELPLRGYDAIHLAAAATVRSSATLFVTADRQLSAAAARIGFDVVRIPRS